MTQLARLQLLAIPVPGASQETEAHAADLRSKRASHVRSELAALDLPPKEIDLYVDGLDRGGSGWFETRSVRDLRDAVRSALVVVLHGPNGTGKSSAACRVLAELCRVEIAGRDGLREEVDLWDGGRYLRAPDYARLSDWEDEQLEAVWSVRNLVVDDLGEEEQLGEKATAKLRLLLTRRDDEITTGTRTIVTTNLTPPEIAKRYGVRVFDRLRELAAWVHCDERVRPTRAAPMAADRNRQGA